MGCVGGRWRVAERLVGGQLLQEGSRRGREREGQGARESLAAAAARRVVRRAAWGRLGVFEPLLSLWSMSGIMSPRAVQLAKDKIQERLAQVEKMKVSDVQVTTKGMIYEMFNDANSSIAAMWISNLINLVIMGSTVGFVLETCDPYRGPAYLTFWFVIECVCVGLFTVDFVVRALTCPEFKEFRGDLMNWVDFIAIVPFYIELCFTLFGWDAAVLGNLRVIRVLRLARVLKILTKSSDAPSLEEGDGDDDVGAVIGEIVSNSFGALVIPIYFMWLTIIVFASVNYYIEKTEPVWVIHHCEDYNDLSTCSLEVPHLPFDSACPEYQETNTLINQDLRVESYNLQQFSGVKVGHPCTIESLLEYQGSNLEVEVDGKTLPDVSRCGLNANLTEAMCVSSDAATQCVLDTASATCSPTISCTYVPEVPAVTGMLGFTCERAEYMLMPGTTGILNPDDASSSDMFPSIPHAIWWCIVTMTTVGYGDKYPLDWKGQVVGIMTASMGIFFISMPLSIVGSSFANSCDKLQKVQDQKDAVKAAEAYGYGTLSFLSKSHAPLIMMVRANCTPLDR